MPNIDSKKLEKIHTEMLTRNREIERNEEYVRGQNPYILKKSQEKKPDNRIPIPLAKSAVEDMAGYAGRAGDIQVIYDMVDKETPDDNDPFIEYMNAMDEFNNEDIETSELYEESLVQGESFELWWVSDEKDLPGGLLTAEYKIVPNTDIVLKYNNSLKKDLLAAIHFIKEEDGVVADIYYPLFMETWFKPKDEQQWVQVVKTDDEGNIVPETYPYTVVPVIQFKANRRCSPLFDAEKPIIDAHDELMSKSLNEVDRFNAVITLLGNSVDKTFVDNLKEGLISVIDELNDSEGNEWPRYLEKNLGGVNDFYNQLANRFERLFHKSVKIPDMTDEAFAGQQSGIAIAFKLIGMEFKASQIETYFNQGLKKRLKLYADVYNASTAQVDVHDYKTIINTQRNIPIDEKSKVEVLEKLQNLISKKTLLEAVPNSIVQDPEKELERIMDEFEPEPFEPIIEDEE